ncbi:MULTISPECIES: bifunctional 4-hydroxy-2-oxoglutarate aldolase/2-dehydro-3-deoxy-phosphogluconate aldolase [Vibrio]|uniref:bifunctional 4-hydroxy-2-oxoglutarate aldolase/2-dehydro-3-deoxy-phosphogluconate aldolase n=1 Tax=Vibrio TaxID=662 RepID=UPI000C169AD2|nr:MULTISPECIES: bifunctional 4-hydroxy-2-oxoglutarate aldolase/2-dehydro-3-deoxy-phosphogluconate aldolase [Vibrio]NNN45549.1 bifunctional 4-hydroxy-2-oxoglutarate aldolase/2-dehydro-3-deoxy-phosphogluconate aldolase [Vibrio sp. 1-1(7)]NNN73167.1 bifunctional 4-hydroxy-2-oxoglutarate aldolase/2-dehydro-3-deoxy-phosphogluconate aldolase [Vibrio sp. 12-2(3-a)]
MNTNEMNTKLRQLRVMPVIQIEDAKDAPALAKILVENGLPAAEITFRSDAAAESIRLMREAYPEMIICAGTVLNAEQAKLAMDSGAEFVVSPGFNPNTVRYCLENNIHIIAGVNSPSQVEQALEMGLKTLKFFPAEASGGVAMLRSLTGPYKGLELMPTGGVNIINLSNYLSIPEVVCCGGTWIAPADRITANDWDAIAENVQNTIETIKKIGA